MYQHKNLLFPLNQEYVDVSDKASPKEIAQQENEDIQLGSRPIDFVVNNLPFEVHLTDIQLNGKKQKYNFARPGTKLNKRLKLNDTPYDWSKPINKLDEAAMYHDIAYCDHRTTKERHPYDLKLAKVVEIACDPSAMPNERKKASMVVVVTHGKVALGIGTRG